MTLHEKARKGSLKGEVFTTEMLNEKDVGGDTVWHIAAECNTLKDIPENLFTSENLAQKDMFDNTVFHTTAAYNTLKDIPKEFFTMNALNKKEGDCKTVWHIAAGSNTLKDIPKELFTEEALSQIDIFDDTVWHMAAKHGSLKTIPKHLLTEEIVNQRDEYGNTVLTIVATHSTIKNLPVHLITEKLLTMKNKGKLIFNKKDRQYITSILEMPGKVKDFIANNPTLELDIVHIDPRLILKEAEKDVLVFEFEGVKDEVILSKNRVTVNENTFDTLNNAVLFIEKKNPNLEQSILIPSNSTLKVKPFVL